MQHIWSKDCGRERHVGDQDDRVLKQLSLTLWGSLLDKVTKRTGRENSDLYRLLMAELFRDLPF